MNQPAINFIEPMKALRVRELPVGNCFYEMKFDGYRAAAPGSKVKLTQAQEFVIGGYTPPEGSRKYFGALLVGYIYAGERCSWGRLQLDLSEIQPGVFQLNWLSSFSIRSGRIL